MKRQVSDRWLFLYVCGVVVIGVGILLARWHSQIWNQQDEFQYDAICNHYRIGKDLWFGRIAAGQDVEELIARSDPHRIHRFEEWVEVTYAPGGPTTEPVLLFERITVRALRGKLVSAQITSCQWHRTFFSTISRMEEEDYEAAFRRFIDALRAKKKSRSSL